MPTMTLAPGGRLFCQATSQLAISPGCFMRSQPEASWRSCSLPHSACGLESGKTSEPGDALATAHSRFHRLEVGRAPPLPQLPGMSMATTVAPVRGEARTCERQSNTCLGPCLLVRGWRPVRPTHLEELGEGTHGAARSDHDHVAVGEALAW